MENKNMMIPPLTVAYNMPKGPKKKESTSAKTMLFEDTRIVVLGSEVFMVLIALLFSSGATVCRPCDAKL